MSTSEIFLIAMGIIFLVPYLVWRVGRTDYFAPLVVVQIITGILLGPGILGAVFPRYYAFMFNPAVVQSLNGIAWRASGGIDGRAALPPASRWGRPVFFLSTGLRTNWTMGGPAVFLAAGVLLIAVGSTMLTIPLATPKLQRLRAIVFKSS